MGAPASDPPATWLTAEDFTVEWPNARLRIRGRAVAQRGELLRLVFLTGAGRWAAAGDGGSRQQ
jgi:hypothetical protein